MRWLMHAYEVQKIDLVGMWTARNDSTATYGNATMLIRTSYTGNYDFLGYGMGYATDGDRDEHRKNTNQIPIARESERPAHRNDIKHREH